MWHIPRVTDSATRAPLKWAGGKFRVLDHLRKHLPEGARLFEPFVGSAVVSLNCDYPTYCLSDANEDLIGFYLHLQQEGAEFVEFCRPLFVPGNNTPEAFGRLRKKFNKSKDRRTRASLLLYLNRHCYNGLFRVNSKGIFNVPHGRYKQPLFPEAPMLAFAELAPRATIQHLGFVEAMQAAGPDDVVYCDPPYVPLSATADFTSYTKQKFGAAQQERLALEAEAAAERGATVVISNHDTDITAALYDKGDIHRFEVRRSISRIGSNRGLAPELLAIYPPR
ncbi:MAG: DNA adenine methylase [Myxococcota bacterium]|jgi:DNA adenine methylase